MTRGAVAALVMCACGCYGTSHHDDSGRIVDATMDASSAFDVLARPECDAPVIERDVGVLFIIQSVGVTLGSRLEAAAAVRQLVPLLRTRTTGVVRFAATTGDAGPGGIVSSRCTLEGRDGVVMTGMSATGSVGPILTLAPGDDVADFLTSAELILDEAGNDECVNQVLEVAARALTPSTVPLTLPSHGSVHGDRETRGLVEPGDILLVVILSDDEDCSWNETVTSTLSDPVVPCAPPPWAEYCCDAVLYPAAPRYVPALRNAADALGVDVGLALIGSIPEADVSLAEWRARADVDIYTCAPGTPSIYAHFPWRILEVFDAFEPYATTQPRCRPDYEAIADLASQLACRAE